MSTGPVPNSAKSRESDRIPESNTATIFTDLPQRKDFHNVIIIIVIIANCNNLCERHQASPRAQLSRPHGIPELLYTRETLYAQTQRVWSVFESLKKKRGIARCGKDPARLQPSRCVNERDHFVLRRGIVPSKIRKEETLPS